MIDFVNLGSIPLFLHLVDPVAVCIINDTLIGCEPYFNIQQSPRKAYNFLIDLYNKSESLEKIPIRFENHFRNSKKLFIDTVFTTCFGGTDDIHGGLPCIDFIIDYNKKEVKPIILKDFIYGNRLRKDFISMDFSVELSVYESFIIFSNICVNNLIYWWWDFANKNFEDILDNKEKVLSLIKDTSREKEQYDLQLFSLGYLHYLREQLQNLGITPKELLRLNGAPVLSLFAKEPVVRKFNEDLLDYSSKNSLFERSKPVYYTYIKHLQYSRDETFLKFNRKNLVLLEKLEKEVTFEFTTTYKVNKHLEKMFKRHKN